MKIYTRKGDTGKTGLLFGGRVDKTAPAIELNGAIDEAQAALGLARAELAGEATAAGQVAQIQRDLWIAMAEVAVAPKNRGKLRTDVTLVSSTMVEALEAQIDVLMDSFEMPRAFVIPGDTKVAAAFDLARTVVRRAERLAHGVCPPESFLPPYLNRLSDLCWALARSHEQRHLLARETMSAQGQPGSTSVDPAGHSGEVDHQGGTP